jgi:hypothetical protein
LNWLVSESEGSRIVVAFSFTIYFSILGLLGFDYDDMTMEWVLELCGYSVRMFHFAFTLVIIVVYACYKRLVLLLFR